MPDLPTPPPVPAPTLDPAATEVAPAAPAEEVLPPEPWKNLASDSRFGALDPEKKLALLGNWMHAAARYSVANGENPEEVKPKLAAFGKTVLAGFAEEAQQSAAATQAEKLVRLRDNPDKFTLSDLADPFSAENWKALAAEGQARLAETQKILDDPHKGFFEKAARRAQDFGAGVGALVQGVTGVTRSEAENSRLGAEAKTFVGDLDTKGAAQAIRKFQSYRQMLDAGKPIVTETDTRQEHLAALGDAFQRLEPAVAAFSRMQAALAEYTKSQPEDFRAAVEKSGILTATFDAERVNKMRAEVRKVVDLKHVIRTALTDKYATLATLKSDLRAANPSMSDAQADALGDAVEKVFFAEVEKSATAALEALAKTDARVTERLDRSTISKLVEQVNLGAFSDARFYNALAKRFNLPEWNDDFAKSVEERTAELQKLPEHSIQRDSAMQKLMLDIAQEHRRSKNQELMNVLGSLWSAGALSRPTTSAVNTSMTGANVFMESIVAATGYVQAARKAGHKGTAKYFFGDVGRALSVVLSKEPGWNKLKVWNSAAALEVYAAVTTGSNRTKSTQQEDLAALEGYDIAKPEDWKGIASLVPAVAKYVGRAMLAQDGLNSLIAANVKQIMLARYLALEEGLSPAELQERMEKVLDSDGAVREAAKEQAAAEAAAGHFGTTEGLTAGTTKYKLRAFDMRVHELRRVEQLVEQNTRSEELRAKGLEFAQRATFNNEPYGIIGMMASRVSDANSTIGWTKPIIPFPRTLSNLVNASIDWSPYGFARAQDWSFAKRIADSKPRDSGRGKELRRNVMPTIEKYSPEYYAAMNKAAIGTAAFGLLFYAVAGISGDPEEDKHKIQITGNGYKDEGKNKQLETTGWRKNTFTIGDNFEFTYTDYPAFNLLLGAAGAWSDAKKYGGLSEKDADDRLAVASLGMVQAVIDKNMLSGVSEIFKMMESPDAKGVQAFRTFLASYIAPITNPGAVQWVQQSFSEDIPETATFHGWLWSLTPVAFLNEKKQINVLGEPILHRPWEVITKRFLTIKSAMPKHPILAPLAGAGLFLANPDRGVKVPVYAQGNEVIEKDRIKMRGLTQAEFYDYALSYGKALKEVGVSPELAEDYAKAVKDDPTQLDVQKAALQSFCTAAAQTAKAEIQDRLQEESKK